MRCRDYGYKICLCVAIFLMQKIKYVFVKYLKPEFGTYAESSVLSCVCMSICTMFGEVRIKTQILAKNMILLFMYLEFLFTTNEQQHEVQHTRKYHA